MTCLGRQVQWMINRRLLGLELRKIFNDVYEATRRVVVRTLRVLTWIDYSRLRALSLLDDIPDNLIVTLIFAYENVVVPSKKTRRIDDSSDIDHNRQFDEIMTTRTNSQQKMGSAERMSTLQWSPVWSVRCSSVAESVFVLVKCVCTVRRSSVTLEVCRRPCSLFPDRGRLRLQVISVLL